MEYINRVLEAAERTGYLNVIRVDDVPYPELVINGKKYLCLCSNNYLGLSVHPEVKNAAIEGIKRYGVGTCESRMVAGNLTIIEELEQALADFRRTESAVVFLSGYLTNLAVIPAIMDSFDAYGFPSIRNEDNLIIKDALAHISIVDACRLSRSPVKTYMHNDMNHLEHILKMAKNRRKLIVTDGVFSMDGDMAPLPTIVELAKKYNAMTMIDDAHATGVIGANGSGTPEYFGVEGQIDIIMGTLSKAFGALGGYIASYENVIKLLKIRATPYIFTSTLPPEQVCAIMAALKIIKTQPELRERLWKNVERLKDGLKGMGFDIMNTQSQIIPIFIGSEEKSVQMERMLFQYGILATAIIFPAVPQGRSRIRCMPMATHTTEQIDYALDVFESVGRKIGLLPSGRQKVRIGGRIEVTQNA